MCFPIPLNVREFHPPLACEKEGMGRGRKGDESRWAQKTEGRNPRQIFDLRQIGTAAAFEEF